MHHILGCCTLTVFKLITLPNQRNVILRVRGEVYLSSGKTGFRAAQDREPELRWMEHIDSMRKT